MDIIKKYPWIAQLIKYAIAGVLGVMIDAGIYSLLYHLGAEISIAKFCGIVTSVIFSYFMNTLWSFQSKISLNSAIKFLIVYAFSILFNVLTNAYVLGYMKETSFNEYAFYVAFLVATFVSVCITFFGLKFWIYKK